MMGLISRAISTQSRKLTGGDMSSGGGFVSTLFDGWSRKSITGQVVTHNTAMNLSAVFRAVNWRSSVIGSMPVKVLRPDGERNVLNMTDHPVWPVLNRRANRVQTAFACRAMIEAMCLLRGVAVCAIGFNPRGEVERLVPLNLDRVTFRSSGNDLDPDIFVEYRTSREQPVILLPGEFLIVQDPVAPHGRVALARETLGLAMSQQEYSASNMSKGTRLSGILTSAVPMKKEQREKALKDWGEKYGGSSNAGRVALLENDLKFTPMSMTNADAEFMESRKFETLEICRWFDCPPHKAYDLSRATFSNIEHQSIETVTDTIVPAVTNLEQCFHSALLTDRERHDGVFFKHNLMGLLRGDMKSRYESYGIARNWGLKSINDIRDLEDENTIGSRGDTYIEPMNMKEAGVFPDAGGTEPTR